MDPDMLLMFERGIRGGITQVVHRYASANNKYMGDLYDEIIPLAIAPVRDAAPNGMLTGKPMNVANVAMLDIPVAMLILLKQAFNHIS